MKKQRPYTMVSDEDSMWLEEQELSVVQLWLAISRADKYGEGVFFEPNVGKTAFFKAKKKLEEVGLCKFEQYPGESDGRKTRWFVTNLHGANTQYYGRGPSEAQLNYSEFLQSDYWLQVREWIIERDNHTCQHCGTSYYLQVHHLTYEHHGKEHLHPEDLITLCRSCHEQVHSE